MYRSLVLVLTTVALAAHSAFPQTGYKLAPGEPRVKTYDGGLAGCKLHKGIVGKIDADGLTLVEEVERTGEVREHQFAPHDILRAGKVLQSAHGAKSYRWEDVKAGDTIEVEVNKDKVDGVVYCTEIFIMKRPKGKLPECQKPDEYPTFAGRQMLNDIDNGEDVSDDDIKKLFPPRERQDKGSGVIVPAYPGGLPKEWEAKLDAIRAKKKEKELKAAPPDKKK